MAMNKFMHPENIYKTPPDYTELAIKFPEFRKISRLELDGSVSVDLRSENVLKVLTKCLLARDFGLEIDLPDEHLVPTVPLRLNYILWLQDIMNILQISCPTPCGIDIGCGASCIYSLLAAKKNNWHMTALEINPTNVHYARENIKRNNLTNLVSVFHQTDTQVIFKDFLATVDANQEFDFCLCNPPFFETNSRNQNATEKTDTRKPPANLSTGIEDEIECEGGEIAFVRRIVEESLIYRNRIRVYTTMLGQKTSTIAIVKLLKGNHITNFTQTEFCQGNTTRWGLAWTFDPTVILRTVPSPTAGQLHKPLKSFTYSFRTLKTFIACTTFLDKIFSEIHLSLERTTSSTASSTEAISSSLSFLAKAYSDHWTNMRRKRRAEAGGDENVKELAEAKQQAASGGQEPSRSVEVVAILTFELDLHYDGAMKEFTIKVVYLDGSAGVNALYQLFQFLKNRVKSLEDFE